jgi:UPF0716 protein FxsA
MFFKLLLVFSLVPFLEIYVLFEVGTRIGFLSTLALIFLMGVIGAYLARKQGLHTMVRIRLALKQGISPADELVDALLILFAGILLATPGFLTDLLGLLVLFPASRAPIKRFLKERVAQWKDFHSRM